MNDHDDVQECDVDPETLFAHHKATAEPLDEMQVRLLVEAGISSRDEWSMRGGGLWWYDPTFPDPDAEDTLPTVDVGNPCPACGGTIVVDGVRRYTGVPIHADGTDTDEGEGGDFEWEGSPHCSNCGQPVDVDW